MRNNQIAYNGFADAGMACGRRAMPVFFRQNPVKCAGFKLILKRCEGCFPGWFWGAGGRYAWVRNPIDETAMS
jgi:hypothetical protein